jgi:hypothetical protein
MVMKKILFPFETNNAFYNDAFVYAVKFARNFGAELIMLNVFKLNIDDSITKKELDILIKAHWFKAYKEIIRFNSYYLKSHARIDSELKIKFDYRFHHGNLSNEMKSIFTEEKIDLLVLPVPDHKDTGKKIMGIIHQEAFEKNNTSVLLVPVNSSYQTINKIIFAADFKKLKQYRHYFSDIVQLANIFDAQIHFLHLSSEENADLPEDSDVFTSIMQIVKAKNNHKFWNIFGKDLGSKVREYVGINQAQLITMVRHQHHFPDTLFHKDYSDDISLKSKVPVIILRERI